MSGPLAGTRIIELAGLGPAPFACMMLADLGAKIIRIDRVPSTQRTLRETLGGVDCVDRGRSSIALDLKSQEGRNVLLRLIEDVDALVESYRPGVAERLGFGPDTCLARNGRLVYGRMSGWGQTGPLAHAAGHDINYIALSGALHAMGDPDRPPTPPLNLLGDYGGGGMLLAFGLLAGLLDVRTSGQGQVVDAAMVDGAALLMSAVYGMSFTGAWSNRRGENFLDGGAPFYACYECSDGGYIAIGAIEPNFYACLLKLCEIEDPAFAEQWDRARWPTMKAHLKSLFLTRTRDAWCDLLEGTDACVSPVLSMDEAALHPQAAARNIFLPFESSVRPAPAPRFSRSQAAPVETSHEIGSDSYKVLRSFGYDEQEIRHLTGVGAVYQSSEFAHE